MDWQDGFGDRSAYTYLPESVEGFPDGEKFITFMGQSGFVQYGNTG